MRACLLAGKNLQHACAAVDAGGGKRADVGAAVQNGLLFGLPVVLDTDSEEVVPGGPCAAQVPGACIGSVHL